MEIRKIKKMDKKAISVMIGYILLISAAVVMSIIVYQWLKSYVPKEALECPSDASLFIKDYVCAANELSLTTKNHGKFNIAGYFIRVTDSPDEELATIDLSQKLKEEFGGLIFGNSILFDVMDEENSMFPNEEETNIFDLTEIGDIYLVEITPIRFQEVDNKIRLVSCSKAKVKEEVTCT